MSNGRVTASNETKKVNFGQSLKGLGYQLREWPNWIKVASFVLWDLISLGVAVLFAYSLRTSSIELPPTDSLPQYLLAPFLSIACAALARIYHASSRGFSRQMELRLAKSQLFVPLVWTVALFYLSTVGFARSVVLIYFVISTIVMILNRRAVAWLVSESHWKTPVRDRVPVLIYGAGPQGALLAETLERQGRYRPMAFVDTDYTLFSRTVNGLRVGSFDRLDDLVAKYKPREVMIAKPGQSRTNKRILVEKLLQRGLKVKAVPGVDEIVEGRINVNDFRPVRVEDLLGRDPVPPEVSLMTKAVGNKVVLITGAGGSIGSELVRQVVAFSPRRIILFERNEFALFEIHREIVQALGQRGQVAIELKAILGDILDMRKTEAIIEENEVEVIFHAAAFKHVRMVQENVAAAIENNIKGTVNLAQAAIAGKVGLFVLVSTDKAVRPTSAMGATKRVSEMVVQALSADKENLTRFAIVRFGNVLGSSGSVVPLFKEQIEKGGPVRVTHPEVTRYFMLISEAAQLVIQASAMAKRCEVYVLDMGDPVKIRHLAESMIELAGLSLVSEANPDGDITIEFVGLSEGEKLYEELQIGNDISPTGHPRIMRSNEFFLPWEELRPCLDHIMTSKVPAESLKLLMKLALMDGRNTNSEANIEKTGDFYVKTKCAESGR